MTGISLYGRMSFYMLYVLFRIMVSICQVISLYISDHYMSIASYHYVNTNRCSYLGSASGFFSLVVTISLPGPRCCGVPAPKVLFLWRKTWLGPVGLLRNGVRGSRLEKVLDPFLVGVGALLCMGISPC